MRAAIFSESPADEAAIRILVNGILGEEIIPVALPKLTSRGWPSVHNDIEKVLKHLHYQTDADAFIIVVDSDNSTIHQKSHEQTGNDDEDCRLCMLRKAVGRVQTHLSIQSRLQIKTAVGLAVPAIEAWYRCGRNPHVSEATWIQALQSNNYPYTKSSLKRDVYGTDRPSLQLETQHAIDEANRLVKDLEFFEKMFPSGFGTLAGDIRNW